MLEEKDFQAIAAIFEQKFRQLEEGQAAILEKLGSQEQRITKSTVTMMEAYFDPKFNLLAEGQKDILEQMTPKTKIEELQDEVNLLKMVIRTITADIAELKKAQ